MRKQKKLSKDGHKKVALAGIEPSLTFSSGKLSNFVNNVFYNE